MAFSDQMEDSVISASGIGEVLVAPHFTLRFEAFDKDGNLKWVEEVHNLVTTVGKTDIIDKYFKGSAYTAAFFMGLKDNAQTPAVGNTMSSHGTWAEVTGYASATRPAITFGTTSAGSNTATAVPFSINATVTIGGAFIVTDSTKGGTTGTLYAATDFAAPRSLISGDTLNVTPTVTAA